MAIEIKIQSVIYPRVNAIATRDNKDEVSITGDYTVDGASATKRLADLELKLMQKAIAAFNGFDAEVSRRALTASIQSDISSINRTIVVPPAPSAPSITLTEESGTLEISGTVGQEATQVELLIDGVSDSVTKPYEQSYSFSVTTPIVDTAYTVKASNLLGETSDTVKTFLV